MVLAIYEVGQSFFRGWGVDKDKKMAVVSKPVFARRLMLTAIQSFFRLASELGDPDAQQELAFCLANGKGCKKDRKEAAKWYRAAASRRFLAVIQYLPDPVCLQVAQGASDIGLAWIYKEKFM